MASPLKHRTWLCMRHIGEHPQIEADQQEMDELEAVIRKRHWSAAGALLWVDGER